MNREFDPKSGLDEGSLPGGINYSSRFLGGAYQAPEGRVSGGNFLCWILYPKIVREFLRFSINFVLVCFRSCLKHSILVLRRSGVTLMLRRGVKKGIPSMTRPSIGSAARTSDRCVERAYLFNLKGILSVFICKYFFHLVFFP